MHSKKILITVNPDFEPEDGTPFDAVTSALEHFEIPANLVELDGDKPDSVSDALANVLKICVGIVDWAVDNGADKAGCEAIKQMSAEALARYENNDGDPKQIEIFQGYFDLEGTTLNVQFQSFVGASVPEKDAAFMAALSQQANVDYHSVGIAGYEGNGSMLDVSEAIVSIMMQEMVGDYDSPDTVPEWAWVENNASYVHANNGESGVWEFVLNLGNTWDDIPEKLQPVIAEARSKSIGYLLIHQGT